jgi:predicted nucleotide-binding protein (sugar kinase/HSP70/actin superfamily)
MFKFIFRKKPTVFLLLGIIVISLIFSILLNQSLHEGLENESKSLEDATINNPPPDIVDKSIKILKDETKKPIQKLSEIRGLLKNKYKVLGDIYRKNESSLLKELTTALGVPAEKDSNGKLTDENALDGDKRAKANSIVSSSDYSAMEKIEKINELAGNDKILSNILNEYVQGWIKMVKDNIEKLKSISNDEPNPLATL